ncbi:hypothetical protein MKY95_23395 [Paenibacillus sp. FSL P4-0176]|uniref:hypothetical protein n=1 Tax=unclassified Paenibacillus TaxID=185978 RepID=UPI0012DC76BA|nr:hypothetical protein [Paenibacillus sp. FSL R5-192]
MARLHCFLAENTHLELQIWSIRPAKRAEIHHFHWAVVIVGIELYVHPSLSRNQ